MCQVEIVRLGKNTYQKLWFLNYKDCIRCSIRFVGGHHTSSNNMVRPIIICGLFIFLRIQQYLHPSVTITMSMPLSTGNLRELVTRSMPTDCISMFVKLHKWSYRKIKIRLTLGTPLVTSGHCFVSCVLRVVQSVPEFNIRSTVFLKHLTLRELPAFCVCT